jgi:N-acetylglutamate synthase-like GNAT family acetyltransferase
MTPSDYRVRRATLDDVAALAKLWKTMNFQGDDLAKRITEFQVAEGADGQLLGAVGLQIAQRQGLIHSEAFMDFAHADPLRGPLWDRLQSVAANHGLVRLWTQEQAPFWHHNGLAKADAESLQKLPEAWRGQSAAWLTLKLKDDLEEVISADKEFALFMETERERSRRTLQHARALKVVATLIAFGVLILVIVGGILLVKNNPQFLHR